MEKLLKELKDIYARSSFNERILGDISKALQLEEVQSPKKPVKPALKKNQFDVEPEATAHKENPVSPI